MTLIEWPNKRSSNKFYSLKEEKNDVFYRPQSINRQDYNAPQ